MHKSYIFLAQLYYQYFAEETLEAVPLICASAQIQSIYTKLRVQHFQGTTQRGYTGLRGSQRLDILGVFVTL